MTNTTRTKQAKRQYDRARYLRLRAKSRATQPMDPITRLEETTVAYLAGLTDADGSIYVTHTNRLRTYYPVVVWAVTDRAVIDWIADLLKTGVVQMNNHTNLRRGETSWGKGVFKTQWRVQVVGSRAQLLCRRMLPYLRIKSQQASLVCQFPVDERRAPGVHLSDDVRALREDLGKQISGLNQK